MSTPKRAGALQTRKWYGGSPASVHNLPLSCAEIVRAGRLNDSYSDHKDRGANGTTGPAKIFCLIELIPNQTAAVQEAKARLARRLP